MTIEFNTEVTDMLREAGTSVQECFMRDYIPNHFTSVLDAKDITAVSVAEYGGEDQGSDYWNVWKFTKGTDEVLVKFYGYYASHYGSDYQNFQIVKPVQRTVTVYE
jgi:hypothetical protein